MTQLHNGNSQTRHNAYWQEPLPQSESYEEREGLRQRYGWLYDYALGVLQQADLTNIAHVSPIEYEPEVGSILPRINAEARGVKDVANIIREEFVYWFEDIFVEDAERRIVWASKEIWEAYRNWLEQQAQASSSRAGNLLKSHQA